MFMCVFFFSIKCRYYSDILLKIINFIYNGDKTFRLIKIMDLNRTGPRRYCLFFLMQVPANKLKGAFSYIIFRLTNTRGFILELNRSFPIGLNEINSLPMVHVQILNRVHISTSRVNVVSNWVLIGKQICFFQRVGIPLQDTYRFEQLHLREVDEKCRLQHTNINQWRIRTKSLVKHVRNENIERNFSLTNLTINCANCIWITCADPEGGEGPRPSLKNHKAIGFLSNTVPDPLKNHKATKPAFNVEPSSASQRNAI